MISLEMGNNLKISCSWQGLLDFSCNRQGLSDLLKLDGFIVELQLY